MASAKSISPGQISTIAAEISNDKSSEGVVWSLRGEGSLSSSNISSVIYTAPSSISSPTTATITATSIANSSKQASVIITIGS